MSRQKRNLSKNKTLTHINLSNKAIEALSLPKVLNINPRSAMNKINELEDFIIEESVDCAFISESHETEKKKS